jgi:hypothetical protein
LRPRGARNAVSHEESTNSVPGAFRAFRAFRVSRFGDGTLNHLTPSPLAQPAGPPLRTATLALTPKSQQHFNHSCPSQWL